MIKLFSFEIFLSMSILQNSTVDISITKLETAGFRLKVKTASHKSH